MTHETYFRRSWLRNTLGAAVCAIALVAALAAAGADAATGPPTNTAKPTVTGTPVVGKALTAHTGTWSGAAPFTYAYQWERCGSTGLACVNIPEAAQSRNYILTSDEAGHRLRVIVTATNSAGASRADTAASAVVKMPATNTPVNTARPSISGSPIEGQSLTATTGTWTGTSPTFAYQWQRCDTAGANCANILGATSSTYSPTGLDVGNTLRVIVTATNSIGSGSSISHQTATIRSQSSVQVSLNANASVVTYGRSVTLSGTVANASAGDTVTIMGRPVIARTLSVVGSTTTDANGAYTKSVVPRLRTIYIAKGDGAQSDSLVVNVRPILSLKRLVGHRLSVAVTAARSFFGRYVIAQMFNGSRWVTLQRVFLTRRSNGVSPTITTSATFRLHVRNGTRVRVMLGAGQAGSSYAPAISRAVSS
jgi:hypothetical protein